MRFSPVVLVVALASLVGCDEGPDYGDCAPFIGEMLINPNTGQCREVGGQDCAQDAAFQYVPDWPECQSDCTGLAEVACQSTDGCTAAYTVECPGGSQCDLSTEYFSQCIETAVLDPEPVGDCASLDANECLHRDDCSARYGTIIGCDSIDPDGSGCPPQFQECIEELAPDSACRAINRRRWQATEEGLCGNGPNGPVSCFWTLWFDDGTFEFNTALNENGTYECDGRSVTGTASSTYQGSVDPETGILTWDGRTYLQY